MSSAPAATTVTTTGQILVGDVPPPTEQIVNTGPGSYITQAGNNVLKSTLVQNRAVTVLGGKQTGGASMVTVHPPQMPTAGNSTVSPNDLYANLYRTVAQGRSDAAYDGLTNAPPQRVGGRRNRKTMKKHKNARSKSKSKRHNRRHSRRSSRVSRVHRRVHG
jgi:hypothetical protein